VIATWCYNIAHDLPIQINKAAAIDFVYVDDVCEFINVIETTAKPNYQIHYVEPSYHVTLKKLRICFIRLKISWDLMIPFQDGFQKTLCHLYFLFEPDDFAYKLKSTKMPGVRSRNALKPPNMAKFL
jgi:UDP-2-acetamido-2,6-beta-L-arabino-hexul-4-ose reductase